MDEPILPGQIWIHNKTGHLYITGAPIASSTSNATVSSTATATVINATNAQDGDIMVLYHREDIAEDSNVYVREESEFRKKFSLKK